MQCLRCGAMFDGRFCPRCGAPASMSAGPYVMPRTAEGWPCPRCGTLFRGNFCPRCGLPVGSWIARPPPRSGVRPVLTILWTLALVGFVVFAVTDFAGLATSPTVVVPGIQGIQTGQTVNSAMEFNGNWTFDSWGKASSPSYQSSGGNSGGFIEMTLFGTGSRGYYWQPFDVGGSVPYTGNVRLDVQIVGGLTAGRLLVSVDSSSSVPDPTTAIAVLHYSGPTAWTSTGRLNADARLTNPGRYYLKIAFVVDSATGPVDVGLDNARLAWTTDAAVALYLPITLQYVFVSQDKALFLTYYGLIATVVFLLGGYYVVRERKEVWRAFKAPIEAIGSRLRSRSAWIAIAQVWMAVTFFQVVVIELVSLAGIQPTTPINITSENAWVYLFDLANAGVYEELMFRLVLIGLPMTIGSLIVRIMEVNRGATGTSSGSAGRYIAGAWRYLVGGVLRRDSPKEAHVAAWALLFASSTLFGLAHAPGWGYWKVIPSLVAGLGFGYLFLRHGVGAAILAHFVNDYILSLTYQEIGGLALQAFISLLFIGLAIAGAGFLFWYALDALRHLTALVSRFRPPTRVPTLPPPTPYAVPTPPPFMAPSAPSPSPPAGAWSPNPTAPPGGAIRDPARIPRDYTPSYAAPPYGYPPVRFQCPYCGWVEARYDAGRFTCTRCGRAA